MALRDIILDVTSIAGLSTSNVVELKDTVDSINNAAREMYTESDLVGSLREQVFAWNAGYNIIAIPQYVGSVRGMRLWYSGVMMRATDLRPRYHNNQRWAHSLEWRVLGTSPLALDIRNAGPLKVQLSAKATKAFTLTIAGETPTATHTSEDISFEIDDDVKWTTLSFITIRNIAKSDYTDFDIQILDIDERVLSEIPNNEYSPVYTHYQLKEGVNPFSNVVAGLLYIEVLYKLRFVPMVNEIDQFLGGIYDKAIYYRTMEHYYTRNGRPDDAGAMNLKCNNTLAAIFKENGMFNTMMVQFAPAGLLGIFPESVEYETRKTHFDRGSYGGLYSRVI
jgi:hypothetical protein